MAVMGRLPAPRSEAYLRQYHWFNVASGDVGLQQAQVGVESFTERRIRKADVPAQWVIFSAIEQEEEIPSFEDQQVLGRDRLAEFPPADLG